MRQLSILAVTLLILISAFSAKGSCGEGMCCGRCSDFCVDGTIGPSGFSPIVTQVSPSCVSITNSTGTTTVICGGIPGPQGAPGGTGPAGPMCALSPIIYTSGIATLIPGGTLIMTTAVCPANYYASWTGIDVNVADAAYSGLYCYCSSYSLTQQVPGCTCLYEGQSIASTIRTITVCAPSICMQFAPNIPSL